MKFTKKELEKLVERADRLHSYWGMPGTLKLHHDMTGWGIDERYADTTETTRFRGTAREVAIWLMGFIAAGSEAKPGGVGKNPAKKTPELSGGARAFMDAVRERLQLEGRRVHMNNSLLGAHNMVAITLINLPEGVGSAGGGAEAENNRFTVIVAGFDKKDADAPPPTGKVTVETSVSVFPREYSLRKKTAAPGRIAEYVAEGINRIVREIPPKFTHTRTEKNPLHFKVGQKVWVGPAYRMGGGYEHDGYTGGPWYVAEAPSGRDMDYGLARHHGGSVDVWINHARVYGSEEEARTSPERRGRHGTPEKNPVWTQQYIDDLPDTAFLIVDHKKATRKDRMGRSHPLSVRHLPYRNKAGKIDKAHLKNAISRAPQTTSVSASVRKAAQERAKKLYARL